MAEVGTGATRNYDYDPIRKRFVFLTPSEGQAEIVVAQNLCAELREAEWTKRSNLAPRAWSSAGGLGA